MTLTFHGKAKAVIKKIPRGKVATYGQVAALAGNPRAARQVVRILHSSSDKDNSKRKISLPPGRGYELQKAMLTDEGVVFGLGDTIDFKRFLWQPK